MSLDRVRAAVMDKAKAEAARLAAEARDAAQRLAAEGKAEDDRLREEALRDARGATDRELARELGQVRQEGRMELLSAKNARLDEAFREARKRFLALPEAERVAAAVRWLGDLPEDAGGDILASPGEAAALEKALPALNQGRSPAARFATVKADHSVEAGALVSGADFTADCTLDRRLEQLRESAAADLAETLFN